MTDPDILGLTADSRAVRPGFLFAALPGTKINGRAFIDEAVARGAAAVLTDGVAGLDHLMERSPPVLVVADPNPRRRLALMASRFYGDQPRTLAAVTGTNGKTSVTVFARQIWERLGHRAASMGTIGTIGTGFSRPGALTTPDPVSLHRDLAELAHAGIDHVALEASSHGLDQFRLDGLKVSVAAFTNLTRDHLDYHRTMESYRAAKARLFDTVMAPGGTAVLNADVPEFAMLAQVCGRHSHRVIGYGADARADIRIVSSRPTAHGQDLVLDVFGAQYEVALPLVGAFQAMNALAAFGIVLASGAAPGDIVPALAALDGVPGRMQRVAALANGAAIYVDYAHTPDALETVLTALRPHVTDGGGKLAVVFGCGGDRDAGKRPVMGEIAVRLADRAVVTDDNPRTERAEAIRAAILAAAPGAAEIGDRAEAIGAAVRGLGPGDILVIAGKGHERGQIVGTTVHPFDDAEVARRAVAGLAGDRTP